MTETITLGLDGANWDLLQPWLDEGRLPNIAALRTDGVATDMQSCLPPVTCPNWRCFTTGKNPGKLGVFWWERIDTDARNLTTPNSRSFESVNYWDYLNDEGLTAGIMNVPMTYPPFEVDAFQIAGGPDSEQDEYTHPPELGDDLDAQGYRLHPEMPVSSKADREGAEGIVELIDDRLRTFREQLRECDVDAAHCTVFYVNVLQHFFYRGEPTRDAWEIIDEHVGTIRETYPDATVVLMSDHGCQDIDTVFYANSWLEAQGYLVTDKERTASALDSLGINKERVGSLAHRLGVHHLVTRLTPDAVKDRVPDSDEGFRRERKLDQVDWDETRAIASGQGLVYVVDGDEETRDEIIADLSDLESDIDGRPIASEIYTADEAYDGPYTDRAPEIVFEQWPGVHTSGAIGSNPIFAEAGQWEAENVRTGFFCAAGPDVTAEEIDPISIMDIAPTVLHSVGCAVPDDMDGNPLPLFGGRPVETRDPLDYDDMTASGGHDVQDRLEDLGYLE